MVAAVVAVSSCTSSGGSESGGCSRGRSRNRSSRVSSAFKQETNERKVGALMAEVVEAVNAAEQATKKYSELVEPFKSDDLEEIDAEKTEALAASEKEAVTKVAHGRKVVANKQAANKQAGPDIAKAIGEMQKRLQTANDAISAGKKAFAAAERLVKGKKVLAEQETKVKEAEDKIENASNKAEMKEELGEDAIAIVVQDIEAASVASKASLAAIQNQIAQAAASLKEKFLKLQGRCKKVSEMVEKVTKDTKVQRERVMGSIWVREATEKVEAMEKLAEKAADVEMPFLKGMEVLPLEMALEAITESESVMTNFQKAIADARNFIATKNLELKKFAGDNSKTPAESLTKLSERVNTGASKLASFKKDTEIRKRTTQMQEVEAKVVALEEEIKTVAEAAAPFSAEEKKEGDEMTEQCEKLTEVLKSAQKNVDATNSALIARTKDPKCSADHADLLKKFQKRLSDVTVNLAKNKKAGDNHLNAFKAKKIITEAEEELKKADEYVEKATEACDPLLKDGGESFLVDNSVATLVEALRGHITDKSLTLDDYFKGVAASGTMDEVAFVAYMGGLAKAIEEDSVNFPENRRAAIFKAYAKDGAMHLDDFSSMFNRKYTCVQAVSMTSGFSIASSKTVCKVAP